MENRIWHPSMSKSERDVRYSCGACGFSLNLSSSDRLTSPRNDGAKIFSPRRKRQQVLEFGRIDDSRFHLEEVLNCYSHRTKFFCGKCGAHIGFIREASSPRPFKRYLAKISALHPEQDDDLRLTY